MSAEYTPVLSGTIPSIEMFMSLWEALRQRHAHLKPWVDEGISWAKKYYCHMDSSKAYAIAMCTCFIIFVKICLKYYLLVINPTIRMRWIKAHWEQHYIDDAEAKIKATISH